MRRKHKFKVGDEVIVTDSGHGVGDINIGTQVTITDNSGWYPAGTPGYVVKPPIGNCLSGRFCGVIGEDTFKLVKKAKPNKEKWVEPYCIY